VLTKSLSVNVLRRDKVTAVNLANLINRDDVWMIQRRGGARFLLKAAYSFRLVGKTIGQYFKRHFAAQLCILRQIDFSHPAGAEERSDPVVAEYFSDRETIARHVWIVCQRPRFKLQRIVLNKGPCLFMSVQQRAYLFAQSCVAGTRRVEKRIASRRLALQRRMKQLVEFLPAFRFH
jgi:hypothetical protein